MTTDVGRVADATGLGNAQASEPHSGLGPTGAIPRASRFVNWIADRFQAKHVPALSRERAVNMAVATLQWVEEDSPFGDHRFDWDEQAAHSVADEEIDHWEAVDGQA